jgi:hypothetical protein
MVLLIALFKTWLDTYQAQRLYQQSLNTGFLLGFGALFDVQYVLLLVLTFVVYIIFGRFSFRTFLIPIIGYLTIWFIALLLDYLLLDSTFVLHQFGKHFSLSLHFRVEDSFLPQLILFSILFLAGLSEFLKTVSRAAVFKRQSFTIYFVLLLLGVVAYLFGGNSLLPLAIIISTTTLLVVNYVQYLKKVWMKELILWAILILFGIFEAGLL